MRDGPLAPNVDRERVGMWVLGLACASLVAFVLYKFIGVFIFGLFVYYATRPVHRNIGRRFPQASIAAATSLFLLTLPALILVGYTVDVGVTQLGSALGSGPVKQYLTTHFGITGTNDLINTAETSIRQFAAGQNSAALKNMAGPVLETVRRLTEALLLFLLMLTFAFFLLRDDHRLSGWIRREITGPDSVTTAYLEAVDRDLQTVYFGNVLTAVVIGVVAAVTYNVLAMFAPPGVRVPYPTLLGLLTGVASLIPVVGMKLVYLPMAIVIGVEAYLADPSLLWYPIVFVIASVAVFDSLFEFVLRPYITGRGLHTGMVVFAYVIGTLLFGWYGLFLGPFLLVAVVHFGRLVLPDLLHGTPFSILDAPPDPFVDDPDPDPVESAGGSESDDTA